MPDIPQIPTIQGGCSPILEIPALEIPDIQPPNLELPEMPGFELPDIPNIQLVQVCGFEIPDVTFPTMADLTGLVGSIFSIPSQYIPWDEIHLLLPPLPTVVIPLWENRPDKYIPSKEFMEYLTALPSSMIPAVANWIFSIIDEATGGILDIVGLIDRLFEVPGLPSIKFSMLLPPYDPKPFYDALASVFGVDLSLYNPLVVPCPYTPPFLPNFDEIMTNIPALLKKILPPYALEFGSMTDYLKSCVQYVFDYCSNLVINILLTLIDMVIDFIKTELEPLYPLIPAIPSGLEVMIEEWIPPPPIPDVISMIPTLSLPALIAKLDIDGLIEKHFPEVYKLKDTVPEEYNRVKALVIAEYTAGYEKIMDTKLPTVPDFLAMVKDILPPLECIFKLPQPLLPDVAQPAEEIKIAVQAFMVEANTLILRLIVEWIQEFPLIGDLITAGLPTLSDFFPMPSLCFPVPVVDGVVIPPIPQIPDLSPPSIAEFKIPDLTIPEVKLPEINVLELKDKLGALGIELPSTEELILGAVFPGALPALKAMEALGIDPVELGKQIVAGEADPKAIVADAVAEQLPV